MPWEKKEWQIGKYCSSLKIRVCIRRFRIEWLKRNNSDNIVVQHNNNQTENIANDNTLITEGISNVENNVVDDVAVQEQTSNVIDNNLTTITAPLVGTYYESSKPGNPPFVSTGQTIEKGQSLCVIEAMKIFNEIESEHSGEIHEILVKDGDPVEYGQPLFTLKEN